MTQQFGNTWWGREWLKALSHIDYANRIPRGAAYARKGAVTDIKLEGNTILAEVAGSASRPYVVRIRIPQFSQKEKDVLVREVLSRPAILMKLACHELSPEILSIASSRGLKVFPERWSDFDMLCSCPDWAVSCKHLAAVVYMFSREIDNNPFIVFEMHGVDLFAELKARGIDAEELRRQVEVPGVGDVVEFVEHARADCKFGRVDFSCLPDRSESILALLADRPPFSPADNFKELYAAEMRRLAMEAHRFFEGRQKCFMGIPSDEVLPEIGRDMVCKLRFDGDLEWHIDLHGGGRWKPDGFFAALMRLNPDFLPDYHLSVSAIYQSFSCALHLLEKGDVVPQILRTASGMYAIRWMPALMDGQVRTVLEELEKSVPDGIVEMSASLGRKRWRPVARAAEWLVSLFLGVLVAEWSRGVGSSLHMFFFKGARCAFGDVGEKEIPGGIRAWLSSFSFQGQKYRPVFYVAEHPEGGFDLELGMEKQGVPAARPVALSVLLCESRYDSERMHVLRGLSPVSSMMPELEAYVNGGATRPVHYAPADFVPFLFRVLPAVRMMGIEVYLPKSLQHVVCPKPTLSIRCKKRSGKGFLSLMDLFAFDWQVALGDEVVSVDKFMRLRQHAGDLIRFKQMYVYADAGMINRLCEVFDKTERMSPAGLLQAALAEEYESAPIRMSEDVRRMVDSLLKQESIPLPEGLEATLRPYQERGYSWLYRNMRIGFGSILADDMGLGKTLQFIALVLKLKEEGVLADKRVLVAVPTGLLANWQAEIARFAPALSVAVYHGGNRDLKSFDQDVLLTTYGVLRSDYAKLKKMKWAVVCIDEAQNIKNADTAQSKAVKSIPADTHIALSGTPVENRLSEFWSIMDYANKGYLGTAKMFKENFANPIQLHNDEDCVARFRKVTAPFMMRRVKTDKSIIADLPDKIERDEYASLTAEQAALYQKTLEAAMKEIEGLPTTGHEALFKRQGMILQMILALKQICNHPAQFLKNGDRRMELSGKAEMLADLVDGILDAGEKVLVFTQFREMGDLLVEFLAARTGVPPLFYHGGCSLKQRQDMVERFQQNRTDRVFILSLKAGGTGLNLTAATHVIHYDLWWNPAVEAQATDRAYRIGQQRNVMVHRFITKDTFEERINDMIRQKKHLADMTVASGESWIGKLSNKELREIFQ